MTHRTLALTAMLGGMIGSASLALANNHVESKSTIEATAGAPRSGPFAERVVDSLLRDIRSNAIEARKHSAHLEMLTRTPLRLNSWEAHARALTLIREQVNQAARSLEQLHELRGNALPWQVETLEKLDEMMAQVSKDTAQVIELLSANTSNRISPEYKEAVRRMMRDTDRASDFLGAKLEYAKARKNLEQVASVR